jgi:hypothetical protein
VDGACEDEYGQEYELRGVLEVTPGGGVRGSLHEDGAADPILVMDGSVGAGRLRLQLRYATTIDTYKYDGQLTTVRPLSTLSPSTCPAGTRSHVYNSHGRASTNHVSTEATLQQFTV